MRPILEFRRREPITNASFGREPNTTDGLPLQLIAANPLNVRQQRIANCPLPAIIAAIANSSPEQIVTMVTERPSVVKSWFNDELEPTRGRFLTNRIINVQFRHSFVLISPFLYLDFFGRPRFASSTDGAGWVSYIEKAYVVLRGQHIYENLDFESANPLTVHQFVSDLIGNYDRIELETIQRTGRRGVVDIRQGDVQINVNESNEWIHPTDNRGNEIRLDDFEGRELTNRLERMLRRVNNRATIATTPAQNDLFTQLNLVGSHTLAVLSYNDRTNTVKLFDTMRDLTLDIALQDFMMAFDRVYQAVD